MLIWEPISNELHGNGEILRHNMSTRRAKVPGGWLVSVQWASGDGGGAGLTFYPDPAHSWNPERLK